MCGIFQIQGIVYTNLDSLGYRVNKFVLILVLYLGIMLQIYRSTCD